MDPSLTISESWLQSARADLVRGRALAAQHRAEDLASESRALRAEREQVLRAEQAAALSRPWRRPAPR